MVLFLPERERERLITGGRKKGMKGKRKKKKPLQEITGKEAINQHLFLCRRKKCAESDDNL